MVGELTDGHSPSNTLMRHQKHLLKNASALNYLKRKGNTDLVDKTVIAATSKKRKVNCTVCQDRFKEPPYIYSTHCGNSSRCPHLSFSQESSATTVASTCAISTVNKDEVASNLKCPLGTIMEVNNDVNNDINNDINNDNKANADSSDDNSTYINADNYDFNNFGTFEGQSKEPIQPGDVIQYYSPIFVAGDPQGLRETIVLLVDPANKIYPLVLCNGEGLPINYKVKRIKVIQRSNNQLVDHPGIFWSIDRFKLTKRGSATTADAISMQVNCLEGIMKKHITNGIEKAKTNGCQLSNLMLHDIRSGDNESSSIVLDTITTKIRNPREYIFPHKSTAEAIQILRCYGSVCDVPGDGSCGYHCVMLLLQKMKLIDNKLSVSLF
jgi:hypothetical protein